MEGILYAIACRSNPNFVFGVRTVYTINKPNIWRKANLAAGIVSFVTFCIQFYAVFSVHDTILIFLSFANLFVPMIVGLLVAYIWGYYEQKREEERERYQASMEERNRS